MGPLCPFQVNSNIGRLTFIDRKIQKTQQGGILEALIFNRLYIEEFDWPPAYQHDGLMSCFDVLVVCLGGISDCVPGYQGGHVLLEMQMLSRTSTCVLLCLGDWHLKSDAVVYRFCGLSQ